MKRRWLIISYYANIDPMAASHHIDDRLPFFMKRGIDINLLSSPCARRYSDIPHMRVPSLAPSGIRYELRHFLKRRTGSNSSLKILKTLLLLPVYPFYFAEKVLFRLDSTWSWFITASIAAYVVSLKKRPDIIYSTGGPVSAHLAAMVASRLLRIPHVAEFQDPLVHRYAAPGKLERYYIKVAEKLILKYASANIFLTKKAAENAAERNPAAKSIAAIYAGASPGKGASHEKARRIVISHFGSLGGSRNLDYFLDALKLLFFERPELRETFRLDLYGNNSRGVRRRIENFPYGVVNSHGKVRREKAAEQMFKADILLLLQNADDVSFETIPSKVYEYLHTGRPILALVYRNTELQEILEAMGHTVVQADDVSAIKKSLEIYVSEWKEDHLRPVAAGSPYTVEKAVDELITLIERGQGAEGR